jgi:hypothetical protein
MGIREKYEPSIRHHSLAPREHHQIPTYVMAALVFLLIAVAGTWAFVVMLVHWRGATTGMQPANFQESGEEREGRAGWFARICLQLHPRARTGRYEVLRDTDAHELDADANSQALSSAHDLRAGKASPTNPFLVAPDQSPTHRIKPRSSAEWAQEHRIYFSSASGSRTPATPSRLPSSPHSLSYTELEDVEAEAREAHGVGERALGRQERASWVDLGLAAVDGAVDRLAGKIVRYTDDMDKDEALLLPLAKGKQD